MKREIFLPGIADTSENCFADFGRQQLGCVRISNNDALSAS